jgi:hypothetical protein
MDHPRMESRKRTGKEAIRVQLYRKALHLVNSLSLYLKTVEGYLNIRLPFPISLSKEGIKISNELTGKQYQLLCPISRNASKSHFDKTAADIK